MHIIVCLDDNSGMLFAGRRQSMDKALRKHVLQLAGECRLWMNAYSAKQFAERSGNMTVAEEFLEKAGQGEFCFVENTPLNSCAGKIEDVILYRWNRVYPSDVKFPTALLEGRHLASVTEFPGNSHETITQERYTL